MYYPVRNPYGQRRSSSGCCLVLVAVALIAAAVVGVHFISANIAAPFLAIDLMKDPLTGAAFSEFMQKYERSYASMDETARRYKIFADNYRRISEFNADPQSTCTLEVNKFADLSDEEFQQLYLSRTVATGSAEDGFTPSSADVNKDWRPQTTPVRDQGMCGSCWTFSTVSVVETLEVIKKGGKPESYSEQELVDCCKKPKYPESKGCDGGEEKDALDYIIENGISKRAHYRYTAKDETCKKDKNPHTHIIKGQKPITNLNDMEDAIKDQTISVGVAAGHIAFRFYKKGVVTRGCPGDNISHAVTVVGAGTEKGVPFWLVRNSWGENWGDKGHIKLMRAKERCGVCGVNCYGRVPVYKDT